MKVGIITYHNAINYGAALQAWALQHTVCALGAEANIIPYTPIQIFSVYKPFCLYRYKKALRSSWRQVPRMLAGDVRYFSSISKKNKAFSDFGKQFFKFCGEPCVTYEKLRAQLPDFDVCFTGSDQVWNPDITCGFDPAYFLAFGKADMVRASYAASIGRDAFSKDEKKALSEHLKKFDFISTREQTACDVIQELTEKPVSTVLDPTLLVDAKNWKEALSIPENKGGYIFVYTLYQNPELDAFVNQLSEKTGLPIVTLNRRKLYAAETQQFHTAGPQKFVELIANASYVVTNSFHGTAFSVNFSKPFVTFKSGHRNSRITDLLGTLGISERAVSQFSDELFALPDIDYASVQEKLVAERKKSIAYIESVLERVNQHD